MTAKSSPWGGDKTVTTLPEGDYALIGSAAGLDAAAYNIINGAKGDITLQDELRNLVSNGAVKSTATESLGLASKVVVEGKLADLVVADLPGDITAKSVSYLVTSSSTSVKLTNATVAQAVDAQATLDAFLANPYVEFANGTKPTDLKASVTSVLDTVANLAAADLSTIGDDTTTFNVQDTAANVEGMSVSLQKAVTNISVMDSLNNLFDFDSAVYTAISGSSTYTATDTGTNITATVTEKAPAFSGTSAISLELVDANATVDITLDRATEDGDSGVTLDLTKAFTDAPETVTFSVTGTEFNDTVTANSNGIRFDGNGGADKLTLGSGDDTIVLGNGLDLPGTSGGVVSGDKLTISGSGATAISATDSIELSGVLSSFTEGTTAEYASGSASTNAITAGAINIFTKTPSGDTWVDPTSGSGDFTIASGGNALVVLITESSSGGIFYVEDLNNDGKITSSADSIVQLLGTASGGANITLDTFGIDA